MAVPTYQYACTECGHGFEIVQSFSDDALTQCPQCTGRLRKVFNSVGIVFKGSGFYRTDSREKPKDGAASGKDSAGSAQPDSPKTGSDGSGAGAKDGASTGGSSGSSSSSSGASFSGASSSGSSSPGASATSGSSSGSSSTSGSGTGSSSTAGSAA